MQMNPIIMFIAFFIAVGGLISLLHEPEGLRWLLLMWAQ